MSKKRKSGRNPSFTWPGTDSNLIEGSDFLMSETPRRVDSQDQYGLRTETAFGSKPGQDFPKNSLQEPSDAEMPAARPMPYNPSSS